MKRTFSLPCSVALLAGAVSLLTGCGTSHPLPIYEPPLARTEFQSVRTTAYTHTEADHLAYGNHNALGGTLHAAGPPVPVSNSPAMMYASADAAGREETGGFHRPAAPMAQPAAAEAWPAPAAATPPPATVSYGSAAADWARWPAGTIFRIVSTGQLYRVDDYGWALSGRNTIDLYQPTRAAMNAWGTRHETIQVINWGKAENSLQVLRPRQQFRHVKRMVLELEGQERAAARLQ